MELDSQDPLVVNAKKLFASRWRDRTKVPLGSEWELVVALENSGPPQSYKIATAGKTVTVTGADGQGVLYGLGHLLRQLDFEPHRVAMPVINETRTPAVYYRGIYFATHFNNFYEAAPIEKVEHYVEEMALWGFDLLAFWFDTNWFPHGFWNDPRSRGSRMIERIRRITTKGRSLGMKILCGSIANEGFANQPPPELRADIRARHGAFYPFSQICPSKPGGLPMILDVRRKVMELVGPVDLYTYGPYDSGGCGCEQCTHAPGRWGKKFLEIGPTVTGVVRELNPQVKIFVATWLMDEAEKAMVYDLCDRKADWFQGLLTSVEDVGNRVVDSRYTRLVLPEISMFDCYSDSYGCNGANPAPTRFAAEVPRVARAGCATMIYSEGVYEDVNKAMYAGLLWNPDRDPSEVLAEYVRYYFGEQNQKVATELIRGLETTWGVSALTKANPKVVAALVQKSATLKARLPRHRDALERWRALRDRATMDWLMKQAQPTAELSIESLDLFNDADYLTTPELRRRLKKFIANLRQRQKLVDALFETHWDYMRFFHFEKTFMMFLPDVVLGKYNLETLIDPLSKAARHRDDAQLRRAVMRAFKRWQWFNGIDLKYVFPQRKA